MLIGNRFCQEGIKGSDITPMRGLCRPPPPPGAGRSMIAFRTLVTGQPAAYNRSLLAKAVWLRKTSSYAASSLKQHDRRNSSIGTRYIYI